MNSKDSTKILSTILKERADLFKWPQGADLRSMGRNYQKMDFSSTSCDSWRNAHQWKELVCLLSLEIAVKEFWRMHYVRSYLGYEASFKNHYNIPSSYITSMMKFIFIIIFFLLRNKVLFLSKVFFTKIQIKNKLLIIYIQSGLSQCNLIRHTFFIHILIQKQDFNNSYLFPRQYAKLYMHLVTFNVSLMR